MLNVLFAYKTLEDFLKDKYAYEEIIGPMNIVKGLAENMVFITQDFSNGSRLSEYGKEILYDYFGRVPAEMRADVYTQYMVQLSNNGYDVSAIKEQAKE